MNNDNKVTAIYCLAKDFCIFLIHYWKETHHLPFRIENKWRYYRSPKTSKVEKV